jgi:polar amino acid transport system substrate-binding protein
VRLRLLLPALALATVAVTSCAAPDSAAPEAESSGSDGSSEVTTLSKDESIAAQLPERITSAGSVRVASGVSFPPMEFFDTDNKTVLGFDADLGKALGEVLGVSFDFENTNFDGIIGGLNAGRYDLSLTSMIDKKERQETVDFVDYLNSGVSFMVAKGNPKDLDAQTDLCGATVAVEKAATGDLVADEISTECVSAGKPGIDKQPFPDQASAVQALASGRADAVMALDLTLAYNVSQDPDSFEVASEPIGALPVGIVIPKSEPQLRNAVQAALKKVQDEGVYDQLLAKWNLTDQALLGAPLNQGQ